MSEAPRSSQAWIWLGVVLLALGLLGHVLAARAIGGSRIAYTHHVLGFFVGLVVFGGVAAALGWRFWRRRPDITLLAVGVAQALFGLVVYMERFRIG
jgi:hypothetical protein